ncbi:PTS glucose transporter subunit IIA [Staphylococcus aureus]
MIVPIAGRRILLKEVRDSIFREKMVGEGLAIKSHDRIEINRTGQWFNIYDRTN